MNFRALLPAVFALFAIKESPAKFCLFHIDISTGDIPGVCLAHFAMHQPSARVWTFCGAALGMHTRDFRLMARATGEIWAI